MESENPPLLPLYCLVLASGFSALVYQTVWLREFRLIFGCSTIATAVVLAIFMGGLGAGNYFFGERVDRSKISLRLYAQLEAGVAILAGISPWLLDATRWGYIELCIAVGPNFYVKIVLRLLLGLLVLGPPTFLMGGTLPAVVKTAIKGKNRTRTQVATLYGINTVGAVFGVFIATFFLFEFYGFRKTLWLAVLINLTAALSALRLSSKFPGQSLPETALSDDPQPRAQSKPWVVYATAFLCGFCFFLLEIVWFRMLGPLLGGTTYSFGIILAVALLGIGLGSIVFHFRSGSLSVTPLEFACSCGLLGFLTAFSFALGDWIAVLTLLLKNFFIFGFFGMVLTWTTICLLVVFPPSLVAGYQFPALIRLIGTGEKNIGRHVGNTFAFNTLGSILGSLLTGFILLPWLSAPECWRLAGFLLLITGAIWGSGFWKKDRNLILAILLFILVAAGLVLLSFPGPSAFFRHSPIGHNLLGIPANRNELKEIVLFHRRYVKEEFEGRESCIGLRTSDGLNFIVNGKSDGNAVRDGHMQVMGGLVSAIFHPAPKKAFVIGLGSGCTSGALARISSMEKVVTAEIEPKMLEVVKRCGPVNFDALENPKLQIFLDDAREVLLTSSETFDLVFSEPSNPYRAGISSLFTREFYSLVRSKLAPNGIFTQWVQAYTMTPEAFSSIYATLLTVFPYVETWETRSGGDFLLLCTTKPLIWDVERLRNRILHEPFKAALASTWQSYDLEGFLAKFVANSKGGSDIAQLAKEEGMINSDDRVQFEYGLVKGISQVSEKFIDLGNAMRSSGGDIPPIQAVSFNRNKLSENRILCSPSGGEPFLSPSQHSIDFSKTQMAWQKGDFKVARIRWEAGQKIPDNPIELIRYCEAFAVVGDARIPGLLENFPPDREIEKKIISAWFFFCKGKLAESSDELVKAFLLHRTNPWPIVEIMNRAFSLALKLVKKDSGLAGKLYESLGKAFCLSCNEEARRILLLNISKHLDNKILFEQVQELEPNPIWQENFLVLRLKCYQKISPKHAKSAFDDLLEYYLTFQVPLSRALRK